MRWFTKFFRKPEPEAPAAPAFNPDTATLDELIAENQRLGREQDAIKFARRELAALIDKKLTEG